MSDLRLLLAARLKTKGISAPCFSKVISRSRDEWKFSVAEMDPLPIVIFISSFFLIPEKPIESMNSQNFKQSQAIIGVSYGLVESGKNLSHFN